MLLQLVLEMQCEAYLVGLVIKERVRKREREIKSSKLLPTRTNQEKSCLRVMSNDNVRYLCQTEAVRKTKHVTVQPQKNK